MESAKFSVRLTWIRAGLVLAPVTSLLGGMLAAALLGLPAHSTLLASAFVFSCVLVGLAQQTIP